MNIKKEDRKYFIGIIIMLVIIVIMGILLVIEYKKRNLTEYSRNLFYMDTYINVKIYSNNKKKANQALDEVENIYKTYHELTDRYNSYDKGLYNLNNGDNDIDSRLYDMILYADSFYEETNGLFNIGLGNVIDIWASYREKQEGVPSINELKSVNSNHDDIKIDEKITLNNNISIDLGAVSKGYATEVVGEYLKDNGLNKFIINAGGNVLVGDYYKKNDNNYKIGIENPTNNDSLYQIVRVNNMAVVTSGGYQRNYTYDGVTYNHIINPNTLYPASNMQSVTVIAKNSSEADILSTTLFLMTIDEGLEFIKDKNVEAIWYSNDGDIIKSEGFSKYE